MKIYDPPQNIITLKYIIMDINSPNSPISTNNDEIKIMNQITKDMLQHECNIEEFPDRVIIKYDNEIARTVICVSPDTYKKVIKKCKLRSNISYKEICDLKYGIRFLIDQFGYLKLLDSLVDSDSKDKCELRIIDSTFLHITKFNYSIELIKDIIYECQFHIEALQYHLTGIVS